MFTGPKFDISLDAKQIDDVELKGIPGLMHDGHVMQDGSHSRMYNLDDEYQNTNLVLQNKLQKRRTEIPV